MAGHSPVDRGKQGLKRSLAVDATGIPLGTVAAPANRPDAPLDALRVRDQAMTVLLDRGYDSARTRQCLTARGVASVSLGRAATPQTMSPLLAQALSVGLLLVHRGEIVEFRDQSRRSADAGVESFHLEILVRRVMRLVVVSVWNQQGGNPQQVRPNG